MFKIKTLNYYIFRELLVPFLVSLCVFTFVLLLARVMELTDLVVNKGVGLDVIGELIVYILPYFFVFTIPMATLLGILLGFLRLSADNEITVMKAAGISLWQMLPPVAVLALAAWLVTQSLALFALPWGNYNFATKFFEIATTKTDLALRERVFINSFPGLIVYVNRLPGQGVLEDIFIVDERDPNRHYTIVAKSGQLFPMENDAITLRLYEGSVHLVSDSLTSAQTLTFETYDLSAKIGSKNPSQRGEKGEKEMYFPELLAALDKHADNPLMYNSLQMELQKMFTFPVGCLVMALIGLPLGIHSRSGRSWGTAMAMLVFMVYYILLSAAWSFGTIGVYPPVVGMWAPNILFLIIGILFFRRELKETPYAWLENLGDLPRYLSKHFGVNKKFKGES